MRAIDADSLNNYKFGENLMASSYADGWDDAIDAIMKDAPTIAVGEISQEKQEAKEFLKTYLCCCPYGKNPSDCSDEDCKFGQAIRILIEEEST